MALNQIAKSVVALSAAGIIALVAADIGPARANAQQQDSDQYLAQIGLQLAPSFINSAGKDLTLVGLGSFIVHASADCNGCHGSDPANEYLSTNNPYLAAPSKYTYATSKKPAAKFDPATYMNGGQNFGPVGPGVVKDPTSSLFAGPGLGPNIITRNLTPDYTGNPAGGIDLPAFLNIMRTGHDIDSLHPACGTFLNGLGIPITYSDNCYSTPVDASVLQVMPWPKFQNMTDYQLTAIWTYLSTIPCNAHNDDLGNTFPWLQNACTAPAKTGQKSVTGHVTAQAGRMPKPARY